MKTESLYWLKIVVLCSIILAAWAGVLAWGSAFLRAGREAQRQQDAEYEYRSEKIRESVILSDARPFCEQYDAVPVMLDGAVYCVRWVTDGAGNIASLEWLAVNVP